MQPWEERNQGHRIPSEANLEQGGRLLLRSA